MESQDPTRSLLLSEDSIDPCTNRRSAIEACPTEILQQIAEYLVKECPDFHLCAANHSVHLPCWYLSAAGVFKDPASYGRARICPLPPHQDSHL